MSNKIYNEHTPDWSDLIYQKSESKIYTYICSSLKCAGNIDVAKRVIKFDGVRLRYDSDCPDCGSVMYCKVKKNVEATHET